ncbi:intracellular ribonuclease LX-like [Lycium ferocissimum]|uniref:intracellular ribonuclease LX-like n=1 Tax=Lycium ferocissimum TaxID=112874 RepID=UPI002815FC01|nr:intracellular ribonuclease LX-like [Lycium ferocissimum]
MKKLPFFLLLILLLEIISVESQSPALLKYVLEWPPTFCIKLNSQEEGRCKEPIPEHELTLHGLMPADEEGNSIKCDPGEDPNWDELFGPIEDELVTFWPSLREDFSERDLWEHEWRAHGACGGTTPQEYFDKAIEINHMPEQGNLFNYLETSGIIASDSLAYPKEDIVEAVQKVFTSPPLNIYLTCIPINPENTTHVYLNEVTLCTNLLDGTEYISCPSEAAPTSCPDEALIMLPHPQAQGLEDPQEDIWKTGMERILRLNDLPLKLMLA